MQFACSTESAILDALTPEELDYVGKASAQVIADFMIERQRRLSDDEVATIVHTFARAVLAPDAPSHQVQ